MKQDLHRGCLASTLAAACVLSMAVSGTRGSELFSESVQVPQSVTYAAAPISKWGNFNILMWGTPALPAQDATDVYTDPFAVTGGSTITTGLYLPDATAVGTSLGPGPVSTAGLSRVTFSGETITQGQIQPTDNPPNQVQFGLVGPTNNNVMNFLGQHWGSIYTPVADPGNTLGYLSSVPIVSVTPHPAPPPASTAGPASFEYIVDFIKFTQGGITGSEWVEFPFLPGEQPTFTYSGWASAASAIRFTENFIQISPTEIPLDDLNYAGDPPPIVDPLPVSEPEFTAEATPEDIVIAVPEPAVGVMSLAGVLILAGRRRR